MIEIVPISCGFVNCYLVKNGENAMLVDACGENDGDNIVGALVAAGVRPEALRLVLLTHGHPDHTGAAEFFRLTYKVPVAMNPLDSDTTRKITGRGLQGKMLMAFSKASFASWRGFLPDIELADGQSLAEYGFPATILALPGHTAGSMGVLLEDGRLLAGDMFMNLSAPHTAYMAEDFATLRQTAEWLGMQHLATIYPGHGKPFDFSRFVLK